MDSEHISTTSVEKNLRKIAPSRNLVFVLGLKLFILMGVVNATFNEPSIQSRQISSNILSQPITSNQLQQQKNNQFFTKGQKEDEQLMNPNEISQNSQDLSILNQPEAYSEWPENFNQAEESWLEEALEKRNKWNKFNGGWGKRGNGNWNKLQAAWGKRFSPSYTDEMYRQLAASLWSSAKRAKWNQLSGMWGKRGVQWSKMSASWGKKKRSEQPNWNKLRGLWGKRNVSTQRIKKLADSSEAVSLPISTNKRNSLV